MGRVFSRTVATCLLIAVLLAPNAVASVTTSDVSFWARFVTWFASRLTVPGGLTANSRLGVPGGVTAPSEDEGRIDIPNGVDGASEDQSRLGVPGG